MARNKTRLYMALYSRDTHADYHVALLCARKNQKDGMRRCHIINRPNPARAVTQVDWEYESPAVSRTPRLQALALLDKMQHSADAVAELLRAAPIVQGDPSWNCRTWLFGAVQFLVSQRIIGTLPVPIEILYITAAQMANGFRMLPAERRENTAVPTCNSAGEMVESEMVY